MTSLWYIFLNRIRYWLTIDATNKAVLSHNYSVKRIWVKKGAYYIPELDISLPKGKFDFVFDRFDVFIRIAYFLKGYYLMEDTKLIFCFDDYRLAITTSEELFIIQEIFVNHCYDFQFPNDHPVVVIDIGMNVGFASLFFAAKRNVISVFSYEPFITTYQDALFNFSLNESVSNKINHFNIGLGYYEENIHVGYNKLLKGKNNTIPVDEKHPLDKKDTIKLRSAIDTIKEIDLDGKIAVMKMDCEGAEYEIFKSFNDHSLPSQIKVIIIERHGEGQTILIDYLVKEGFVTLNNGSLESISMIYACRL